MKSSVNITVEPDSQSKIMKVTDGDAELIGKLFVMEYDRNHFPGIIQDVDHDSVKEKTMQRNGKNRYFWSLCGDVIGYKFENVIF